MNTTKTSRLALGLTQQALSELLGVSRRTVYRWETGEIPTPKPVSLCLDLLLQVEGTTIGKRYGID